MSYRSVLVHVQPDQSLQHRLEAARDVAERFDAVLTGMAVENIRSAPFDDRYSGIDANWFVTMRDTALRNQQDARAHFDAVAVGIRTGSEWITAFDVPAAAIAKASSGADLIVTSRPPFARHDPYMDAEPAELALISGRPVLVAPTNASRISAKRIVLAWKDVREARRAMSDAMPFLKQAEAVLVLELCSADETADAEIRTAKVVTSLARRGVHAESKVTAGRLGAGGDIIRGAELFGADLIVSGAYGHTRLGEWAFGGVTRELLAQNACFVLLSH